MAGSGPVVFFVVSVLCLGQSDLSLEFLFPKSSCTIISSVGSFLLGSGAQTSLSPATLFLHMA